MPRFDRELSAQAQLAVAIVRAGEISRVSGGAIIRKEWTTIKLEALYELAYLRAFAAWEKCLEAVFYRSLCGYTSTAGQEVLIRGHFFPTLAAAEAAVLGGFTYLLWHNPQKVIDRCHGYIRSGPGFLAGQELTISSNLTRLEDLAATRHRIVHDQADALTQNPKTDTEEIRGKLGQKSGRGDEDDAQEGSYGRADRSGTAAGASGSASRRGLPQGGDQPGDVLSVETEVYRGGSKRVA
jgi:hypothetical protein